MSGGAWSAGRHRVAQTDCLCGIGCQPVPQVQLDRWCYSAVRDIRAVGTVPRGGQARHAGMFSGRRGHEKNLRKGELRGGIRRKKIWKVPPWHEHLPFVCKPSPLRRPERQSVDESQCVHRDAHILVAVDYFFRFLAVFFAAFLAAFFLRLAISVTSFHFRKV